MRLLCVKNHWKSLASAFIFIYSTASWADVSDCDAALVKSTYASASNVGVDWRLADLVSQQTYDEIMHDGGANAVIYGVPVGASYKDFKSSIASFKHVHQESLSFSEKRNIAWTGVDPSTPTLYRSCLDAQVFAGVGLHAAAIGATASDISILVRWFSPGGPNTLPITWQNADPAISDRLPDHVPLGETIIILPRPHTQTSIAANAIGYTTGTIVLEPLPAPPPVFAQAPAAPPERPDGWYGFGESNNKDQEPALHGIEPNIQRIPDVIGTFDTLCRSIGKRCIKVVDFQRNDQACSHNPNDGSRIAYCAK